MDPHEPFGLQGGMFVTSAFRQRDLPLAFVPTSVEPMSLMIAPK